MNNLNSHWIPTIPELTRETKWKIIKQFEALGVTPDSWLHDSISIIVAQALERAKNIGQHEVLNTMEQVARTVDREVIKSDRT